MFQKGTTLPSKLAHSQQDGQIERLQPREAKLLVFSEVASTPAEFVLVWVQPQSVNVACVLRQDLDPSQAA